MPHPLRNLRGTSGNPRSPTFASFTRRPVACPHSNTTSLYATTLASPMRLVLPAPPMERVICTHGCSNCQKKQAVAAPADPPRPACTTDGKSDLHTRLQQLSKEAGLGGRVRINKSGCLDQCEHGPTVVVYPEAVWYGNVRPEDAAAIVTEHLIGGRPVERLRIADECLNSKTCPHRS